MKMANMSKQIIVIVPLGILMAIFLVFAACDKITLEDPKVAELEKRMEELSGEFYDLVKRYDDLININRALNIAINEKISEKKLLKEENASLRGRVTSLNGIIATKEMERSKKFTIKFNNGELYNKTASRGIAARVVNLIKHHGADKVRVTIKGYSSHNGPADLNMKLSKDRAEGVMHKIHEAYDNGPLNIDVYSFGETSDNERKVVVEVEVMT